ncbi:MAG: serine racemase VanT catalytic subunit [Lachnospiraceae bacterium]|nr:serine racemase VanT catalytic subunit [Lachnospiraceae bacterium]
MKSGQNYGGLDRFRILAAVLVIAIHTSPLGSYSADADFFLTRILARVAVPFFFMVTGQFVLSPQLASRTRAPGTVRFSRGREQRAVWSYLGRLALVYGGCVAVYLPLGIYAGHYRGLTLGKAVQMLVFEGTFYHLWYFPACMLGILLVTLLGRFLGLRGTLLVSGAFYVIGLLGDSYYGVAQRIPALSGVYDVIFQISPYTRNGLFFAPLFLALGCLMGGGRQKACRDHLWLWSCFVLSFVLMSKEGFLLRRLGFQRHDSMYVFLVPVMIFLYKILLSIRGRSVKRLRSISTWIYIVHPAMIVAVRGAARIVHMTELLVDNSLIHYAAVTVLSIAAAAVISYFGDWVKGAGAPGAALSERGKERRGRAWIELDREALSQNVEALLAMLPDHCSLMPAVKADAYGHGAVLIARELNRIGVEAFCVASAGEGEELRREGVRGEILVLGYTDPIQFDLLHRCRLTQTIVDYQYAERLNGYGKRLHVHIGVDTGMHRLGIGYEERSLIMDIFEMKNLAVDGLFTHLCTSDGQALKEQSFTDLQARRFYSVVDDLERNGYSCPKLHLQSSYGILNYPKLAEDYARVGIALYGVLSTREDTKRWEDVLRPVLSLKARVACVRRLCCGETAGYGMAFTAQRDMEIATITVGYGDGLPRNLSGGQGFVLINGRRAPVVGRICMDQTIVDVSGIPDVKAGDVAVLIGKSGDKEISAGDLAGWAGTITNEILSRMGARLERVMV